MQNPNTNFEGALSWDSTIEKESEFVLLEAGEYDFTITKMERGQFQPTRVDGKIKEPCPKAELTVTIATPNGEAHIKESLLLHTATEGLLSAFFICIGQKKKGEPLNPNWGQVIGSTGKAKVIKDSFKGNDGKQVEINRIDRWLEPANRGSATSAQQPVQQPTQQPVQAQSAQNTNASFSNF